MSFIQIENNKINKIIDRNRSPALIDNYDNIDDDKYNKYNKKTFFNNFAIFITILISCYFYILSLEGCHDTQTYCLVNLNPQFFHKIIIYLSLCSFILSLVMFMILKGNLNKKFLIPIIIMFYYLTFFYDIGSDLSHHGSYNRIVLFSLLLINFILLTAIDTMFKLLKLRYLKVIISIIFIFFVSIIILSYKLKAGCNRWSIGLNEKEIVDDGYNCKIIKPSNCWIELIDGLLDISWLLQEDCDTFRKGERRELMKYLPSRYNKSNYLGYPITTNFTYVPDSYHIKFFDNIMYNFIDMNDSHNNNLTNNIYRQKPEIYLKFDNITNLGKINIEIERNEQLIKKRNNLITNDTLVNNVLVIYIDSISRQHFLRKMKKTSKFIEKYIKKHNNLTAYQYLKYHAFIFFTQPNTNPMFYGESMIHNNGTHIIKHFQDKGFITAQSNNICTRELYDIQDGFIENLKWVNFDHENIALFCDPNYFNPENPFTPYMGPYSIKKRCLYGRDTFEYVLEYGEEFWKKYEDQKKFLRIGFQDAHEGTGEVSRYLDDKLIDFLENFERKGWLNDTAVLIVSDHGNNMIGFYNILNCEDFVLEKTLASLFMIIPDTQIEINKNEQTMITPYDIYNTLLHLIDENKKLEFYSRYGSSLLEEINEGNKRSCKDYSLDMKDEWCRCKNNN